MSPDAVKLPSAKWLLTPRSSMCCLSRIVPHAVLFWWSANFLQLRDFQVAVVYGKKFVDGPVPLLAGRRVETDSSVCRCVTARNSLACFPLLNGRPELQTIIRWRFYLWGKYCSQRGTTGFKHKICQNFDNNRLSDIETCTDLAHFFHHRVLTCRV